MQRRIFLCILHNHSILRPACEGRALALFLVIMWLLNYWSLEILAIYLDLEDWGHKSLYIKHISIRGRPDWLQVISSILLSSLQNPQSLELQRIFQSLEQEKEGLLPNLVSK